PGEGIASAARWGLSSSDRRSAFGPPDSMEATPVDLPVLLASVRGVLQMSLQDPATRAVVRFTQGLTLSYTHPGQTAKARCSMSLESHVVTASSCFEQAESLLWSGQ